MGGRRSLPHEIRLQSADGPVRLGRVGVRRDAPVLAVIGSTAELDASTAERLLPAFAAAVDVAAAADAVVVTGGTDAGVFHLFGLALASAPRRPRAVIGVAPDDLVADPRLPSDGDRAPVDPQLTALVRVPGKAWGAETGTLSRVVEEVAGSQPVVVLLAGGGDVARSEVLEHLSKGRSLVVLSGSGRLADDVATGVVDADETDLRALLSTGDVRIVPADGHPGEISRVLHAVLAPRRRRSLRQRIPLLEVFPRIRLQPATPPHLLGANAASRYPALRQRLDDVERVVHPAFEACDVEAQIEQNRFRWFTVLAILGGLLTTAFGAVQAWLMSVAWPGVVVATLGAATSAITTVARRQGSLDNYLGARIRAERLRSLAFRHLALAPEPSDAVHRRQLRDLEQRTAEIESGPVVR